MMNMIATDMKKRFGLIVDGVHTCPEAVKLAFRTSPKRLVTV